MIVQFNRQNYNNLSKGDLIKIHNLTTVEKLNALQQSVMIAKIHTLRNTLYLLSLLDFIPNEQANKTELLKTILDLNKAFKLELTNNHIEMMQQNLTKNKGLLGLTGIQNRHVSSYNICGQVRHYNLLHVVESLKIKYIYLSHFNLKDI